MEKTLVENTELEETLMTLSDEVSKKAILIQDLKTLNAEYQTEADRLRELVDLMNIEGSNIKADPNNLRVNCNATEEQLNRLLENTALAGHGWEFLEAEHKYTVNAIMMMSIMKQESGLGKYTAVKYNAVGMKNGSGGWRQFKSFKECIEELAKLLGEQYLDENGKFYNGMSITDVNVKYCLNEDGTTIDWEWSQRVKEHSMRYVSMLNNEE